MKQRSPEWFTARKGRVTGSNVGAILGVDPFRTKDDVLRAMVRSYHKAPSEFTGNVATEWGVANESTAIGDFEIETGLDVKEVGFFAYEDWAGASPDGLCSDGNGLEVKCPFGKRKGGELKSIEEQPHYYDQMQFEMLCTGWPAIHLYQWTPHTSSHITIDADQEWRDKNMPILRQFYALYLSELKNPEHLEPLRVEINTAETRRLIDELDQLKEAIDNAIDRKKEVEAELIKMAGERNALIWGVKITKVSKEGSISYAKAIKELAPDADLEKWRGVPSEYWRIT